MKIKFTSNIDYQTFPITDDMIELDEEIVREIGKTKQYKNGQIVDYISPTSIKIEISVLKKNLTDTDYQAIKFAENELTEDEFAETKLKRASWRSKINELEEELAKIETQNNSI